MLISVIKVRVYKILSAKNLVKNSTEISTISFDNGALFKVQIVLNDVTNFVDEHEVLVDVEEVRVHPQYDEDAKKMLFDFALLRVFALASHFDGCFRPACIPRAHAKAGTWCHVAGWGKFTARVRNRFVA